MELFVGSLSGGEPTKLSSSGPATFSHEMPAISGRKVVWMHLKDGAGGFEADIYSRRLGGSQRRVVDAGGPQFAPDVDGKRVVWEDARRGDSDIWMRRGNRKPVKVAGGPREQWNPQIDGRYVTWWEPPTPSRGPAIGFENLRTGRSRSVRLADPEAVLGFPAIGGGILAWYEDRDADGIGAIRFRRLGTAKNRTAVSEGEPFAPRWTGGLTPPPVVSTNGTVIAYSDERPLAAAFVDRAPVPYAEIGRDVFVVAVTGGSPVRVSSNRGDQAYPSVGGGTRVIWLDASSGRTDLVTTR